MVFSYTSPYGVTFGVNPGSGNPGTPFANWSQFFADMATLGVKKLRFQYSWDSLETPQGTFNWAVLDDAVSQCNAHNIELTFPIGRSAPSWAKANASQQATDEPFFHADPTMTASLSTLIAQRYNGGANGWIDRYEIQNEDPNIHFTPTSSGFHVTHASSSPYWGSTAGATITAGNKYQPARDPQYYVPILKACYPAIKAVSNVPVGMGSMWWVQPKGDNIYNQPLSQMATFLQYLYTNGCAGFMDFVNLHYYSNGVSDLVGNAQTVTIAALLAELKAVIASSGSSIPVKITEFGWQVGPQLDVLDGNTQWQQYFAFLETARRSGIVDEVDFFTLAYGTNFSSGSSLTSFDTSVESYRQPTFNRLAAYMAQYPDWTKPPAPGYQGF